MLKVKILICKTLPQKRFLVNDFGKAPQNLGRVGRLSTQPFYKTDMKYFRENQYGGRKGTFRTISKLNVI